MTGIAAVARTLNDVLAPASTALIVWDMQVGIAGRSLNIADVRPNVDVLIDAARAAGVVVIWSRHIAPPVEYAAEPVLRMLLARQSVTSKADLRLGLQVGTEDVEFLSGLAPRATELVLEKSTPSFFIGTPLELRLRALNIRTVVLVGVATEHGIEFTARHASALGFFVVVAEDAVGTYDVRAHENSLSYLRGAVDVVKTTDIARIWGARPAPEVP